MLSNFCQILGGLVVHAAEQVNVVLTQGTLSLYTSEIVGLEGVWAGVHKVAWMLPESSLRQGWQAATKLRELWEGGLHLRLGDLKVYKGAVGEPVCAIKWE